MDEYISKTLLLEAINTDITIPHNERCAQLLEAILNAPTVDVAEIKNNKWRPHYHIFENTGEKMREGWYCSVCGKHSYLRKEICDGCNTTMWKVEIQ